ncbi:MAG: zf-HC2 domain-containing protein [Myxococcales bacterium]|nr:zf-HC2 domain-containing protein [Myxococcales bacterium]
MNCRQLAEQVDAYLDGDLDEVGASACRGHLRTCAACRDLADQQTRLRAALAELPPAEPPAHLWAAIDARLGAAEIADSRRGALATGWSRLVAWLRPVAWPVAMVGSAGAIALAVVQLRGAAPSQPLALRAPVVAPAAAAPPVRLALRDALDERADLEREADGRFRQVVSELLPLARAEVATWAPRRAQAFAHDLERREQAVLVASPGHVRERAWHDLTSYLERVALGEQVAMGGGR